jgi:hypothetical protein
MPQTVEPHRQHVLIAKILGSIAKIFGAIALGAVVLVGGGVLILLALGPVMNSIFPGSQDRTSTTSPRLVEITLGHRYSQTRLRVPAAYMNWSPNLKGGEQELVKLAAHWPDMGPISLHWQANPAPSMADSRYRRIYSEELVEVRVMNGGKRGQKDAVAQALVETPDDYELTDFGLYRYRWTDPRDGTYHGGYQAAGIRVMRDNQLYVTDPSETGEPTYFTCTLLIRGERIFCYGVTNVSERAYIEYRFRSEMLPEWRAIDAAARALVQGMIVDEVD